MKYSKYPRYKDSGVEWLGEIPEHWEVSKIKNSAIIFNGATPKSGIKKYWDGDISWIGPADMGKINSREISRGARDITSDGYKSCGTTLIPKGSVVLSARAPIGKVAIAGKELCTNQGCKSLIVNQHFSNIFIFYILISNTIQLNLLGRGTTFLELSAEELSSFNIPRPPLQEQKNIANYLDKATVKIDTLIEKQIKLIELLKEKRQAVISTAVTRGLDSSVPMKDSGVAWLGEIPEGWNRSKLGYETTVKARLGWKGLKADEYVQDGYIFLATPNIKNNEIDFLNVNYITEQRYKESPEIMLMEGDVLVTKDGSTTGTTNVVRILPKPATVNSSIAIIRPRKLDSIFLYYYFKSTYIQETINLLRGGMGVPHLFQADLRFFNILVPPHNEQQKIANYLDDKTSKIDNLITKATKAIDLLGERRTALISAVVTGKIDVREYDKGEI